MNDAFEDELKDLFHQVINTARNIWITEAQNGLSSTREQYINAISEVKYTGDYSGYIELRGSFPVMIEEGFPSYDMKEKFKNSKAAKKDGENWYVTVPFRHTTSKGKANSLPSNVLAKARGLSDGERLTEAIVRELGYKPQTSHTGYHWKNAKYDSLQRIIKEYPTKRSSQYLTFRRASNKSDPASWIHPGYKGLHALDKVQKATEEIVYSFGD